MSLFLLIPLGKIFIFINLKQPLSQYPMDKILIGILLFLPSTTPLLSHVPHSSSPLLSQFSVSLSHFLPLKSPLWAPK